MASKRAALYLDRSDALPVGTGLVNLFLSADPNSRLIGLDAEHRVSDRLSIFGEAHAGYVKTSDDWERSWGALGGARLRW